MRKLYLLIIFFNFFTFTCLFSQSPINSLDLQMSHVQSGVNTTDGKILSYYELKVTNYGFSSIQIHKIERFIGNTKIDTLTGESIKGYVLGTYENYSSEILPGQTIVIFLSVLLEKEQCQSELSHQVEFGYLTEDKNRSREIVSTKIDCAEQIYIAAPFADGLWIAVYSPMWKRGHRRVIYASQGKANIPGKYAIDFVKVDEQGSQYQGDKNAVKNWYSYGEPVYSGVSGTVVDMRNDFIEYDLLSEYIYPDPRNAAGNFVTIETDYGKYLHYEHLKPNSIKVNIGQKINVGDEIALLGFTGGTVNPHLHVHVSDGKAMLSSGGIPFGLKGYESVGRYMEDGTGLGSDKWKAITPKIVTHARPLPNEVISITKAAHPKTTDP